MSAATITLLLQILVQFGPEAYTAAVNLFKKPAAVTPADFDALTLTLNKPLHTTTA
jgi:hypothetical protein